MTSAQDDCERETGWGAASPRPLLEPLGYVLPAADEARDDELATVVGLTPTALR